MSEEEACVDCINFEDFGHCEALCTYFDFWFYTTQDELEHNAKECVHYKERKEIKL